MRSAGVDAGVGSVRLLLVLAPELVCVCLSPTLVLVLVARVFVRSWLQKGHVTVFWSACSGLKLQKGHVCALQDGSLCNPGLT